MKDLTERRRAAVNAARQTLNDTVAAAFKAYDTEVERIEDEIDAEAMARHDLWNGKAPITEEKRALAVEGVKAALAEAFPVEPPSREPSASTLKLRRIMDGEDDGAAFPRVVTAGPAGRQNRSGE